jgi:hypothetical protein
MSNIYAPIQFISTCASPDLLLTAANASRSIVFEPNDLLLHAACTTKTREILCGMGGEGEVGEGEGVLYKTKRVVVGKCEGINKAGPKSGVEIFALATDEVNIPGLADREVIY